MNVHTEQPAANAVSKLSPKQRFDMNLMLNAHCKTIDGYAVYDEGWDDLRVAAELGIPLNSVGYIRRSVFGKLKSAFVAKEDKTLVARVDRLEAQVAKLVAALGGV